MELQGSLEAAEKELNLDEALAVALDLAHEAGREVLRMRAEHKIDIEKKFDVNGEESNIVTAADKAAEALIVQGLKRVKEFQNHSIRGEEGATEKKSSRYEWIIDPIDGTFNFSRNRPFSVSIGLAVDGKSTVGVLYFPDDNVTLSAIAGKGAFRETTNMHGETKKERMKKDAAAPHVPLSDVRLGFDVSSGGNDAEQMKKFRLPIQGKVRSIDRHYCSTSSARQIMEGKIDAYVCGGGLTPFDLAAMMVIMNEAGYVIEGMNEPLDLAKEKNPIIMASDQALRNEILRHINTVPDPLKRKFFEGLADKYSKEMRLLLQGGHLGKRDGWRNVVEHCLVQTAAAEELCAALHFSLEDTKAICSTAAIHDWKKRWERTGKPVPDKASELLRQLSPHDDLLTATDTDFLADIFLGKKKMSDMQEIQFYVDVITKENEIVPSEERIKEVEVAPRSHGLAEKANGNFWKGVRALRDMVEAKLFTQLHADYADEISSPADIPLFLRTRIERHWK